MAGQAKPIRWGILSDGEDSGWRRVIPAIGRSQTGSCRPAIASRGAGPGADGGRGSRHSEGLRDLRGPCLPIRDIDAIYNPLPNHLHVPLTVQAVEAGKHVLCEKPIALNAEEARQLLGPAEESGWVAEGFMVRAHPQWIRAREDHQVRRTGRAACDPVAFQLLQCRPGQYPQHGRYRRRRPTGYRLLSDGGGALFSSRLSRSGRFP